MIVHEPALDLAPPAERREHLLIEVLRRGLPAAHRTRTRRARTAITVPHWPAERGPRAPATGDQPEHDRRGQRKQADRSLGQRGGHDAQARDDSPARPTPPAAPATAASTAAATAAVVSSDTLASSRLPTIAHETTGTRIQNRIGSQSKSDATGRLTPSRVDSSDLVRRLGRCSTGARSTRSATRCRSPPPASTRARRTDDRRARETTRTAARTRTVDARETADRWSPCTTVTRSCRGLRTGCAQSTRTSRRPRTCRAARDEAGSPRRTRRASGSGTVSSERHWSPVAQAQVLRSRCELIVIALRASPAIC